MALIQVLHTQPAVRERVRAAVNMAAAAGARHELRFANAWEDLQSPSRVNMVRVVDAYPLNELAEAQLRPLLVCDPIMPLVVYSDFRKRPASDVRKLTELGIRYFISFLIDDGPVEIRRTIASAMATTAEARIDERLSGHLTADALQFMMLVLRVVEETASREARLRRHHHGCGNEAQQSRRLRGAVAAQIGLSEKGLERRCTALGLTAPAKLIRWCRLFHAAPLLADPQRNYANIAEDLGFKDEGTLRKWIRSLLGRTSRQLRHQDAIDLILTAFLSELRWSRVGDRESVRA